MTSEDPVELIQSTSTQISRGSQAAVTGAIAFLFTLVIFGNVTDFSTNAEFIHHVLAMDTIDPDASIRYRAIESPFVQRALFLVIIGLESVATGLMWTGSWRMLRNLPGAAVDWARAKSIAVLGLTLTYLIMQVAIFAVGNEWFGMWRSKEWNGVDSIFRTLVMVLGALIYVGMPEKTGMPSDEDF